jgi:hypothetical protein
MSGNAIFAVPKDRQAVTIRLDKGIKLEGEIFLEYMVSGLSTHQKVTAFLENENLFFPIKLIASGVTEFVNKKTVQTVVVGFPGESETGYFSHLLMHSIRVTARFCDGTMVSGDLMAEVPQEKARLSDCLNMSNRFLSVKTGATMCYINKEALQKVVHADKA